MTIDRPPAPADSWKDIKPDEIVDRWLKELPPIGYWAVADFDFGYERVKALLAQIAAARLATEQQHQQEMEQLTLLNANQRQRLEAERDAAQVQCADAERFANKLEQHTARLRAALESALPYLEEHQDAGPTWEGWKSDDLLALISEIESALAASPAPQETDR